PDIIRYFMTISEASQLVLQSGAMAKNGELFVLDMGKPVKIVELAENMIRLSGFEPYVDIEIKEIGLRPGEKLYEELLVHSDVLEKTSNSLIFVEKDEPWPMEQTNEKLEVLRAALDTGDDDKVRSALHYAVPTYKTPEEINAEASQSKEMKQAAVL
ncbi:MAG: polysaccharide biosynthesis protein, partial [Clostridia bacterium]|nr:polysaccharide biosynthesis protein [Clostridia bacterium]